MDANLSSSVEGATVDDRLSSSVEEATVDDRLSSSVEGATVDDRLSSSVEGATVDDLSLGNNCGLESAKRASAGAEAIRLAFGNAATRGAVMMTLKTCILMVQMSL